MLLQKMRLNTAQQQLQAYVDYILDDAEKYRKFLEGSFLSEDDYMRAPWYAFVQATYFPPPVARVTRYRQLLHMTAQEVVEWADKQELARCLTELGLHFAVESSKYFREKRELDRLVLRHG